MLTVFKFDTFIELKKAGNIEGPNGLIEVLKKFYTTEAAVN
jgi:hypothetical protein